MEAKIILFGQEPSAGDVADIPFGGRPGKFLGELMDIENVEKLGDYFERMNVFAASARVDGQRGDRFDFEAARLRIAGMHVPLIHGRLVIFLGKKVALAFGRGKMPPFVWETDKERGFTAALYPHPSGRDEFWKDQANVKAAFLFFDEIKRGAAEA